MASEYGYATITTVENRSGMDYSAIGLSDEQIEAQISQAERLVNIYCGQSFSGTIPDGVVYVVLEIAVKKLWNLLLENGYAKGEKYVDFFDQELKEILNKYRSTAITPIKIHRLYNNDATARYS